MSMVENQEKEKWLGYDQLLRYWKLFLIYEKVMVVFQSTFRLTISVETVMKP